MLSGVLGAAAVAVPIAASTLAPTDPPVDPTSGILEAASNGVTAVLGYRSESVDADVARAQTYLTGDFLTYFRAVAATTVVPGARARGLTSTATVSARSLVSATELEAVTLLFVDQTVTGLDLTEPQVSSTSLRVRLGRVDGQWLVSALDPI
ncbi:Mce-associated membrane protein [Rhodococcoides kroppenstedtii]|uniref:Mce-associated membrane protein n=1 Tax=Rhodococcoides kroppenstedtii TaxID=293050 RepID=A0A1I0UBT9_9NOCA|nr:hypothetical protein [Rhodococcus kroppenstedtii]SFA61559.1 Mce-associated membrane protein [Rhodococcus kroppenstedtii]